MSILDPKLFAENQNGRVVELQLSALKEKASPGLDLLLFTAALALAGFIGVLTNDGTVWITILIIVLVAILAWLRLRLPAFITYYFLALPDARENNPAYTIAKLDYRNGYTLQAEDVHLTLAGDGNAGLIAGNMYGVYYLPRAKVAISARIQQDVGEAQQAREFTGLFGKVIGFTEDELAANRAGKFPLAQRLKIVRKNWFIVLAFALITAYTLWQVIPMLVNPAFLDDAILFTICNLGLLFFLAGVIYLSSIGAKGVLAALVGGKVKQVEGIAYTAARTVTTISSRREYYYLEIPGAISLEISKRVYDVLMDGLSCRICYSAHPRYLVSVEVLNVPGVRFS